MPFLPSTPGSNFQDYLFNQQQDSRKRGRRGADNDRGEESKPVDPITVATEEARNAGDASMQAAMEAAKPTLEAQETERQFESRQQSMGKNRISRIAGSYRDADGVKRNSRTSEPMSDTPRTTQTSPSRLNREPAVGFRGMAPAPANLPTSRPTSSGSPSQNALTIKQGKSGSYTGDVKIVKGQYGTAMAQTGESLKKIAVREQNRPMTEAIAEGAAQDATSKLPSAGVMRALEQGGGARNAMPSTPGEIAERSNIVMPSTPDQIANLRNQMPFPGSGPANYVPNSAGSSYPVMPGAAQTGTASIPTPSNTMATVTPGRSPDLNKAVARSNTPVNMPPPLNPAQRNKIHLQKGDAMAANFDPNRMIAKQVSDIVTPVSEGVKAIAAAGTDLSQRKLALTRRRPQPRDVNQSAATPSTGLLSSL